MADLILHKAGAYNLYTTVADGPCFESALTLDQLREYIREQYGQSGIDRLHGRLERAHKNGCSSMLGETLEECIACNRAGPNEAHISLDEFVARYLTLTPNV
jgi:hypothetical protein